MWSHRPGYRVTTPLVLALLAPVALAAPAVAGPRAGGGQDVPAGWSGSVFEEIRASEYRFASQGTGGSFSAPNRAHDLRTRIDRHGIEITSRVPTHGQGAGAWRLSLRLAAVGREGGMAMTDPETPSAAAERVEIQHGAAREWYLNDERGLEQGFVIDQPPVGDAALSPLILEMSLDGLRAIASEDGLSVEFFAPGNIPVLRYTGLTVTDAAGRAVAARLALDPGRLRILIEDGNAVYPIQVDPLFVSYAWSTFGAGLDQPAANLGESAATAGDVNGDGYSDVIVGASYFDNGATDEGAVFVFLGSPSGLAPTAAWRAESDQAGSRFGISAGTAGDVNGDSFDDVIVGAPLYDNVQIDEGRAYLWLGGPSGLGANGTPANADWVAESDQAGAEFGTRVAAAGDVNGSGRADVLVGAPKYDNGSTDEGRAYVYLGVAGGLAVLPVWTAESNQLSARFGYSAATAGDVNGDGFSDVVIGAYLYDNAQADEGAVFLWYGASTFGSGADGSPANAAWMAESDQASAAFGFSVGTAGDVSGDGYSDIIVGSYHYDNGSTDEGAAFLWNGSSAGPGVSGNPGNADWSAEGNLTDVEFGYSVGTAGDVDGDGFADAIISAPHYTLSLGRACVWQGGPAGLGPAGTTSNADWCAGTADADSKYGYAVGTAGDVNGDGFSDAIVGEPYYGPGNAGRVLVYHGLAGGLATTPGWSAESGFTSAAFGASVASAGDVNGDGYGDLIVGAPSYDNGQVDEGRVYMFLGSFDGPSPSASWTYESNLAGESLGASVAAAGDVNGDGLGDVILGAPLYSGGQTGEGRALVFAGTVSGLATGPSWSMESDVAGAQLGSSVAGAGDVNGDGFSDVIVGAPLYSNGQTNEGLALVFYGGSAGPASIPSWSVEGDSAGIDLGAAVASAGDVNADRFSDVIVGAPLYGNGFTQEGLALVYLGSGAGLSPSAAWSAEGDQRSANLGASVASAGDVNGDGFSDVIVGAYRYDNGSTNEGSAFLWYGGASFGTGAGGIPGNADWRGESDLGSSFFGASVASAGDVNGDGFSDVIIGSEWYANGESAEGSAFVWFGSATGPSPNGTPANADWIAEGNLASAHFGRAVAAAGDVNGDGFCDVVVGAPQYTGSSFSEGAAFLYYGDQGEGLHRAVRQARRDDTGLVGPLGRSDHETEFRFRIWGRTPLGRGDIRMQSEVKPLGAPFDGTGLVTTSVFDSGSPFTPYGSAVAINRTVVGLDPATFYHWRVRLLTDSPFFPRSPWFSHPYNNRTETDIRTAGCVDLDGDGYGAPGDAACPGGLRADCDDGDVGTSPTSPEICDNLDNNCDGTVDDFITTCGIGPCTATGSCTAGVDSCVPGPPAPEICDGLDNDCDGTVAPAEMDLDGDGVRGCQGDCDNMNPAIIRIPEPIEDLEAHLLTPTGDLFTWTSQADRTGSGTVYDIFAGDLWGGGTQGDFSLGRCFSDSQSSVTYDSSTILPSPGQIFYLILRGQNACPGGTGTYGTSNQDATAALSPGACL